MTSALSSSCLQYQVLDPDLVRTDPHNISGSGHVSESVDLDPDRRRIRHVMTKNVKFLRFILKELKWSNLLLKNTGSGTLSPLGSQGTFEFLNLDPDPL